MPNQFYMGVPQEDDFSAQNMNQYMLGVPGDVEMLPSLNKSYLGIDMGHDSSDLSLHYIDEGDQLAAIRSPQVYTPTDWTDHSHDFKQVNADQKLSQNISEKISPIGY
jgi:hypothetical protein